MTSAINNNCAICWDELGDNSFVHPGNEGYKHPYHFKCIKDWVNKGHYSCPACFDPLDRNSLLSWKEKTIIVLNHVKNDIRSDIEQLEFLIVFAGNNLIRNVAIHALIGAALGIASGRGAVSGALGLAPIPIVVKGTYVLVSGGVDEMMRQRDLPPE